MAPRSPTRRSCARALVALVVVLLVPASAVADEVWLKNGDHLSGRIIRMERDQLFLESDQAGDVYIDWENIERLRSDKPLAVRFQRGAPIPDNVGTRDEDRLIVQELEAGGPVDLATIRSINQVDLYMKANFSAGGNQTSGNTNTGAFNLSFDGFARVNRHKVTLDMAFNQGQAEGELTVENARGALRYDYFLTRSLFTLILQSLEQDTFQNLAVRSTTTAGLGYELLNLSSHELIVGAGPTAVYTDFTTEPSYVDPSAAWILRWYYEVYRDVVKLYHNHQGWFDLGQREAFRINATQGMRVEIFGDLNMHVEYVIRLNTDPARGRKDLDTSFVLGLTYAYER